MLLVAGLLALVVSTGFCAAAARALGRWIWRDPEPHAWAVTGILLFTVIQSLLVLVTGLVGWLAPGPLVALTIGGWALLWATGALAGLPWRVRLGHVPGLAERLLLGGGVLLVLSIVLKGLLLRPSIGDALTYHLPNVAEWVQARRFVYGFTPDPRLWFPMGFELVETWWVVFIGRDPLLALAGLQMVALGVASVGALARAHSVRPSIAMLVFAFIPAVILHATSGCNDLASAAMVLAGYALVAARAPLPLQVLPILVGAGVKPTALFGSAGVIAYFLVTPRAALPRPPRGAAVAAIGAGLVLGGFWFARNWILKGHPLYPVYGGPAGLALQASPVESFDTLRRTLVEFPGRAVDPRPFSVMSPDSSSWGWFVLPWGLPLTIVALARDRRLRTLAACFIAGAFLTIALSPMNQLNLRFAMWFPALVGLGAAATDTRGVILAVAAAAGLNFGATLVPGEIHNADPFRLPDTFPRTEPIACITSGDSPCYLYYNSDFSRRVSYPRSMAQLRASGARYAVVLDRKGWAGDLSRWRWLSGRLYEIR